MNPAEALHVVQTAVATALVMSAPMVIAALVVGVLVAFLQALTQVQEMTLTFVPKIVAVLLTLYLLAPLLGQQINHFTTSAWSRIEMHR